jgi:hypothetical protein
MYFLVMTSGDSVTRFIALCALGAVLAPASMSAQAKPAPTDTKKSAPMVRADRRVWPDEGPATWTERKTVPAITANDLRTRLYQFADDSMMGRRIGEPGNYKGTEYIANEFKRMGLKPLGENGTYFQTLPFGPLGFDSTKAKFMIAGEAAAQKSDWVPVAPTAANGFGSMADLNDVPAVFAGRWGDTTIVLDPAVFAGKIAVFIAPPNAAGLTAQPANPRGPVQLERCDSLPDMFGAQAAVIQEAADRAAGRPPRRGGGGGVVRDTRAQTAGAKGILFITIDGATPQSVGSAFNMRMGMQPAERTGIPAAAISQSAGRRIFGTIDMLAVGAPGKNITAQFSQDWRLSDAPARNVIAVLPGSDPTRAAEYVLVGAHNDHVGTNATGVDHDSLRAVNTVTRRQGANDPVCRPTAEQQHRIDSIITRARSIRAPRRDSIMNGADDDGSGTVVMLEIAEQFAKEKPARSIIFISHQGEEGGLLGSRWFADHPTVDLKNVVAAHNMDMLGKGRVDQVKYGGPSSIQTLGSRRLSREFGDIIDSVNAVRSEVMAIDKSWDVTANPLNRFCRSDQVNYVRKDIPVTYFSTGYAQDYHQATDEPRYIEYDHSAKIARFIHDVMMAIAERKDRPAISGPDPAFPRC